MIETYDETCTRRPPAVMEFGCYEDVLIGRITNDECLILDNSSISIQVLRCKIKNINPSVLSIGTFYRIRRESGIEESWLYNGLGRIQKEYCIFTIPTQ
jgi:hypothetical protein